MSSSSFRMLEYATSPQDLPRKPAQGKLRQSFDSPPIPFNICRRRNSPDVHRIVRNRDRVLNCKEWLCMICRLGNLRQLPHPRHKPDIFRSLSQEYGSVSPVECVVNVSLLLRHT